MLNLLMHRVTRRLNESSYIQYSHLTKYEILELNLECGIPLGYIYDYTQLKPSLSVNALSVFF
jgi:hypothetical protein